jgi:hypothetical protein
MSLVDDVDELERLNDCIDIVPQTDARVPPASGQTADALRAPEAS